MDGRPIYIQLMEFIEDNILVGNYSAGDLAISSTQLCKLYNVNPATAIRALSELADSQVLVKDRGIGMRVTQNAKAIIEKHRKQKFLYETLDDLISEAKKLGIAKKELVDLIKNKEEL